MTTHTLKIKPEPFADLLSGVKTCEVRANHDRDFRAGDTVTLLELAPLGKPGYSGRQMTRTISHVQEGYGLPVGLCVLSYAPEDAPGFTDWMRDHGGEALRHELGVEELMEGAFQAGAKSARVRPMSPMAFQLWVLEREHPVYGWLDRHWLVRGDNPDTYADPYVQGLWVALGGGACLTSQ